jgi:hypothetical protein
LSFRRNDGVGEAEVMGFTNAAAVNVAGATTLASTLRVDGASDLRGAISNGGSATCWTGVTGIPCFTDDVAVNTGGNSLVRVRAGTTASEAGLYPSNSSNNLMGSFSYWGSAFAATALRDAIGILGLGVSRVVLGTTSDVAAGTAVVEVRDASLAGTLLASVDGAGNLFLNASATRSKGTITLAAGTGTVTVASGSICVCGNTSALNMVQCNVSSTTLTATGTGTDVIAYHCL